MGPEGPKQANQDLHLSTGTGVVKISQASESSNVQAYSMYKYPSERAPTCCTPLIWFTQMHALTSACTWCSQGPSMGSDHTADFDTNRTTITDADFSILQTSSLKPPCCFQVHAFPGSHWLLHESLQLKRSVIVHRFQTRHNVIGFPRQSK